MKTDRQRARYLRWHKSYEKRAHKELRRVFRKWASEIKLSGRPNQWEHQIDSQLDDEDLFKAFSTIYYEIGVTHGKRVGKHANMSKKDFNPMFFEEAYKNYIAMYLQQNVLSRVFDLRVSFVEWVAGMLRQRVSDGLFGDSPDPSRIATWLQQQARKRTFYRWQALRIARTESTAASNLGGFKAVKDSGYVMEKIWVSSHDSRTRRHPKDWFDHAEMNGKKVRMDDKFEMPSSKGLIDRLEFPGDPKGHGANTINCRCTLVYKPMKANGRLVRQ